MTRYARLADRELEGGQCWGVGRGVCKVGNDRPRGNQAASMRLAHPHEDMREFPLGRDRYHCSGMVVRKF